MSQAAMSNLIAALKTGAGLKDEFIYYMSFDDYKTFPDPFPRTAVSNQRGSGKYSPLCQSGKTRRVISVGHSRPTVYAGKTFHSRHGRSDDSRRRC